MPTTIHLESEAQAFAQATANPPYLFDLGPERGRPVVDEVQSGSVDKLPVELEDRTIAGGPSRQGSVRIVRPPHVPAPLPPPPFLPGAGVLFGNPHPPHRLLPEV